MPIICCQSYLQEVSEHPVFEFEILDSCVHAAAAKHLDLWRENDETFIGGPLVRSPRITESNDG